MFVEYLIVLPVALTNKVSGGMQNQNIHGFLEQHMKFSNSKTNDNTNFPQDNANVGDDYEEITNNENDSSNLNETDSFKSCTERFVEDPTDYSFDNVDFNLLIGETLLDLRENFKAATCKIS